MWAISGHTPLYYYNEAVESQQWSKAANYLISVYSSGVMPYKSGAGEDIQNQKLVPTVFVYTLDPQVAGIYQFLVKIGFLQGDPQADALINSGKVTVSTAAIPAQTLANVLAQTEATQQVQSDLSAATTSAINPLFLLGGGFLLFMIMKKKKTNASK